MENNLITIKIDRVIEERPKSLKLQIPFKMEDKEYYWSFWLPKSKTLVGTNSTITIPKSFIYRMKEGLQKHTFTEIRYVAKYRSNKIRFIKV